MASQPELPSTQPDPIAPILARLSVPEKVGQLLLLGFPGSDADDAGPAIRELHAGGIALVQNVSSAEDAMALTAALREMAAQEGMLPLLVAIDHEGGSVQRLRSGVSSLGSNWELGQTRPLDAAVEAARLRGVTHGQELLAAGINMNLAPVLDVWDNPDNRVIAERSYSSDPAIAGRLGAAYIEALQAQGVLAVAKHFPGHGSTDEDSHLVLPVLSYSRERLEAVEIAPFRSAVAAQVAGIMSAHVSYPALDPTPGRPASLSPVIISTLLRGDLGYDGLVVTDDMGAMRAITDNYEPGEAAIQAVLAGSDILVVVGPLQRQQRVAEALVAEIGQRISVERLDASVRRVLRAKRRAGLLP